jgi:FtsH-binding integral membrane protein
MFENNSEAYLGCQDTYTVRSAVSAILKNVYLWMTMALLISGFTAMLVAGNPVLIEKIFAGRGTLFLLFLAQFGLIWLISSRIGTMSFTTATLLFIAYSLLTGVTLSSIFVLFTVGSIASVFFITAGTFGAMSFVGYFMKKDLSAVGRFLTMALIGLIIASLVNIFLQSSLLMWICTISGVLLFSGLTAYDTQKIKQMFLMHGAEMNESTMKLALMGSLTLYLDFINLFLYLLRIFGDRK